MDRLPDELFVHIVGFLHGKDIARVQRTSKRYLRLGRDQEVWKQLCFNNLRTVSGRVHHADHIVGRNTAPPFEPRQDNITDWDPIYPSEKHDYYQDYITRHAKISLTWFGPRKDPTYVEDATLWSDPHLGECAVTALEDGGVSIYDLSLGTLHRPFSSSKRGLLMPTPFRGFAQKLPQNSRDGANGISVDTDRGHAFFAVGQHLMEVDLATLELVSASDYPFQISTLSPYSSGKPLIAGTNETIHIHDHRTPVKFSDGLHMPSFISLTERGPLSILHPPDHSESIWLAGRFSSILQYSLKHWGRPVASIHSGGRISQMTILPYPFVPTKNLDNLTQVQQQEMRAASGWTAICAGAYKGKGSLEMYGFNQLDGIFAGTYYRNRQSAARSKLLAVAPHCGKIVYADGNGMLRWVERNGATSIRSFDLHAFDTAKNGPAEPKSAPRGFKPGGPRRTDTPFASYMSEQEVEEDMIQKIMPYSLASATTGHSTEKLLIWTSQHRVGVLGFGPAHPVDQEEWHDAVEIQAEATAERARRDAEVQYQATMRRALQRNADEVRFVRGLGLA